MTNEEIRRMMELVDEKYIDELTETGDPDRIAFAEEERSEAEDAKRQFPWVSVLSIAAAFALLIPGALLAKHVMETRVLDPASVESVESVPETEAPEQNPVPFAEELKGRELQFDLVQKDMPFYLRTLEPDAEQAFLTALESLRWEPLEVYPADLDDPIDIQGTYFTMYADRGSQDGFAVTFARDNGQILWGKSTEVRTYSLSAEEFDMLRNIVEPDVPTETQAAEITTSCETLDEANAADRPWKGKLLRTEQIGTMTLESATDSGDDTYEELLLVYTDPDDPAHCMQIRYTTQEFEEMSEESSDGYARLISPADTLSTYYVGTFFRDPVRCNGSPVLCVECGKFNIQVSAEGCIKQDMKDVIIAIKNGWRDVLEEPVNGQTFIDDVTYEQAQSVLNIILPDEIMGWQESPESVMELVGIQLHQADTGVVNGSAQFFSHGVNKWLVLQYEGEGGYLEITAAPTGILDRYNMAAEAPELPDWSMKILPHEPYAKPLEDGKLQFRFVCRFDKMAEYDNMDVLVSGICTEQAIDPFANFYSVLKGLGYNPDHPFGLADANAQDAPWMGDVITPETIGSYQFQRGFLNTWTQGAGRLVKCESLYYIADRGARQILVGYTTQTPEETYLGMIQEDELDAKTLLTDERFYHENPDAGQPDSYGFVIDRGDYRFRVIMTEGIPEEDVQALIDMIKK